MCGVFLLSKISFGKTDFNKARRILQIPSDTRFSYNSDASRVT